MKQTIIILILLSISILSKAQNSAKTVLDTLSPNSIPIIVYSDYSWEYMNTDDKDDIFNLHNIITFDTISNITEYWDNSKVYSYTDTITLKDTFDIVLIDSITREFQIPFPGPATSGFGPRRARFHYGVDINVETGDSILAAFDGKIRYAKYNKGGYGNFIIIRHFNGTETCYGHLSEIYVDENQYVRAGTCIGLGGNTGRSYGSHLHFETRYKGNAFDPTTIIDFNNGTLKSDTLTLNPALFGYKAKLRDPIYYKIRSGDTLSRIAVRQHSTITKLCSLNRISRTTTLRIGRIIRVR